MEPEHLLLAIFHDEHSNARIALRERECPQRAITDAVVSVLESRPVRREAVSDSASPRIELSPHSRMVLDRATEIARRGKRYFVGPEHILEALIAYPTPDLAAIWIRHNVTPSQHAPEAPAAPFFSGADHQRSQQLDTLSDWAKYTDAAQNAIAHAQSEATRSGFNDIPALFLLSGVLQESETVVTDALKKCGVERDALREALIDLLPTGLGFDTEAPITLDVDALAVADEARRISGALGDRHIGTEHLFLGLLSDRGSAGDLLRGSGAVTANFLDALRYVRRGKVAEAGNSQNPLANLLWWMLFVAAVLALLYFARQ